VRPLSPFSTENVETDVSAVACTDPRVTPEEFLGMGIGSSTSFSQSPFLLNRENREGE